MRRITGTTSLLIGLLALVMWTGVAAQQSASPYIKASGKAYGNVDAITQDELKTYEYFLSADQLEGRNLPSRGYDTAALYIASHMKEWGLTPARAVAPADGPLQSYLVPFELVSSQNDIANMKLSITLPAAGGRGGRGGAGAPAAAGAQPGPERRPAQAVRPSAARRSSRVRVRQGLDGRAAVAADAAVAAWRLRRSRRPASSSSGTGTSSTRRRRTRTRASTSAAR